MSDEPKFIDQSLPVSKVQLPEPDRFELTPKEMIDRAVSAVMTGAPKSNGLMDKPWASRYVDHTPIVGEEKFITICKFEGNRVEEKTFSAYRGKPQKVVVPILKDEDLDKPQRTCLIMIDNPAFILTGEVVERIMESPKFASLKYEVTKRQEASLESQRAAFNAFVEKKISPRGNDGA